jgi:hypothetical protein
VLAVCAIRLNGQTDRVIRTVRITIGTKLLPYHSSLLIIYSKAAMLVKIERVRWQYVPYGQTDRVIRTVRITIRTRTVAMPQ